MARISLSESAGLYMQMATGLSATSLSEGVPTAQSKRERAMEFARQIPRPSLRQQHIDDDYADSRHEAQQQTPLEHFEQQYLIDQRRLASIFHT